MTRRAVANHRGLLVIAVAGAMMVGCSAAIDATAIGDAQIAVRVKTALVNDSEIGEFPIEVRVVHGVAALSGRVRSAQQVERALALTRAVEGVTRVQSSLQVGGVLPATPPAPPERIAPDAPDLSEIDTAPNLLALGASVGWSLPGPEALKNHVSLSPLVKLGSPEGLSPVVAFEWFQADLESVGSAAVLTRVHVKPVMVGLGYTLAGDRLSFTPSIVGGYAFNSLTVTDTGVAEGLPVEVRNSLVWRVGASAWYDVGRRMAVTASTGYLRTKLRLTVLEDGRLTRRDTSGDTIIVHVGLAYRLF
jgi:hypothetical protein